MPWPLQCWRKAMVQSRKRNLYVVHAANRQVSVVSTGYAADVEGLVYLGVAGHKTALKSIWATLNSRKRGRNALNTGWETQYLAPRPGGYVSLWTPIPQTNLYHLAVISRLALPGEQECFLLAWQSEGAALVYPSYYATPREIVRARRRLADRALPELKGRLVRLLNRRLAIPILPEWADFLWRASGSGLYAISCGGDCVAAYRVEPDYPWEDVISRGLQEGRITF